MRLTPDGRCRERVGATSVARLARPLPTRSPDLERAARRRTVSLGARTRWPRAEVLDEVVERVLAGPAGSTRSSRCSATPMSPRSWSTATVRCGSSGAARSSDRRAAGGSRPCTSSSNGSSRRSACASTERARWSTLGLPDGSRVNVVVPPLAVDGPCITIRRFGARRDPAARACAARVAESVSPGRCGDAATSSSAAAPARARPRCSTRWPRPSPAASGSSRSKTPPSSACPATHVVRLEARPANADGLGAVTVRDRSSATRCACDPTASSSARCGAARRSTWCRR